MMRSSSGTGSGHSPVARLVALLIVIGMAGVSAPELIPVVRWVLALL